MKLDGTKASSTQRSRRSQVIGAAIGEGAKGTGTSEAAAVMRGKSQTATAQLAVSTKKTP